MNRKININTTKINLNGIFHCQGHIIQVFTTLVSNRQTEMARTWSDLDLAMNLGRWSSLAGGWHWEWQMEGAAQLWWWQSWFFEESLMARTLVTTIYYRTKVAMKTGEWLDHPGTNTLWNDSTNERVPFSLSKLFHMIKNLSSWTKNSQKRLNTKRNCTININSSEIQKRKSDKKVEGGVSAATNHW